MKQWSGLLLGAMTGGLVTGICLVTGALFSSTLEGLQEAPAPTALSVVPEPAAPLTPPTSAAPLPGEAGAASGGLPVTRLALQGPYEGQGFAFQRTVLNDGRVRWLAASPDGLALVEIIGAEQVEQASITTFGSADADAHEAAQQIVRLLTMLHTVFPDWPAGAEWLSTELVASAREPGNYAADLAHAGIHIDFTWEAGPGALTLSFRPE